MGLSLTLLVHFGVDLNWGFLAIAVVFTAWFVVERRITSPSNEHLRWPLLLPAAAPLVAFAFSYLGVQPRWDFVVLAACYTVWFALDRKMHTRANRSHALLVIVFWVFVLLAFFGVDLMWGFLAAAIAVVLSTLDQRRASGQRRTWRWPYSSAPAEARWRYRYGDACLVAGAAAFFAAGAGGSSIAFLSLVFLGTGVYFRYRAWRTRKAAEPQEPSHRASY
jgi:hypothetical protein